MDLRCRHFSSAIHLNYEDHRQLAMPESMDSDNLLLVYSVASTESLIDLHRIHVCHGLVSVTALCLSFSYIDSHVYSLSGCDDRRLVCLDIPIDVVY